jgi:hypothetical protein
MRREECKRDNGLDRQAKARWTACANSTNRPPDAGGKRKNQKQEKWKAASGRSVAGDMNW